MIGPKVCPTGNFILLIYYFLFQAIQMAPPPPPAADYVICEVGRRTCSEHETWYRRAMWDWVGLSHCWYNGLLTVQDEACLRWGHYDQPRQGHQCSETMRTGESRFHISIPLGIETWAPMTGSKGLTQWTSETVYECSEIALHTVSV